MNNQNPLIPQGSFLEQKNKGRARVKIAVFVVLAVHGVGLIALLMQGCGNPKETSTTQTNQTSQAEEQTPAPPAFQPAVAPRAEDTNQTPPEQLSPPPQQPQSAPSNSDLNQTPPQSQPQPQPAPQASATEYKIARGDTFTKIAEKFHVPVKAILDANPNVDPRHLKVGQAVQIPPPPPPEAATPGGHTTAAGSQGSVNAGMYSVKSGDTLSRIARRFGTTVKALRAANDLKTDRIRVGQKLKLPPDASAPQGSGSAPPPQ